MKTAAEKATSQFQRSTLSDETGLEITVYCYICLFSVYHACRGRPSRGATDPTVVHTINLRLIRCVEAARRSLD